MGAQANAEVAAAELDVPRVDERVGCAHGLALAERERAREELDFLKEDYNLVPSPAFDV